VRQGKMSDMNAPYQARGHITLGLNWTCRAYIALSVVKFSSFSTI